MHDTNTHELLADAGPVPKPRLLPSFQVTPPVHILDMVFYGVKYPFGQFRSPVLAMLPPSGFFLLTSSVAEQEGQKIKISLFYYKFNL